MVKVDEEKRRVVGVYVNRDIEGKLQCSRGWIEEREKVGKTLIGGDFNARMGEEGGGIVEEGMNGKEEGKVRRSKDGKVNKEGKTLIEFIEERGWSIYNGVLKGDEKGEYTYTGSRGSSVIGYVIRDEITREKVRRVVIGEKVDSDHHPIEVTIEKGNLDRRKKKVRSGRAWRGYGMRRVGRCLDRS